MATAIDLLAPLPFTDLCPTLRTLLAGTGARGRRAIAGLAASYPNGAQHHIATRKLTTAAGTLTLHAFQVFSRQVGAATDTAITLSASLDLPVAPGGRITRAGLVHQELHVTGVVIPQTIAAACIGRPIGEVVDLPDGFPGRHLAIRGVRTFTRSTRFDIAQAPAGASRHERNSALSKPTLKELFG